MCQEKKTTLSYYVRECAQEYMEALNEFVLSSLSPSSFFYNYNIEFVSLTYNNIFFNKFLKFVEEARTIINDGHIKYDRYEAVITNKQIYDDFLSRYGLFLSEVLLNEIKVA